MTNAVDIRAPAEQSEGTRSQVLRWLKAVGDPVSANEPLIELETDKVTVEVAAPASGVLREILKQAQEDVDPGELLGRIELSESDARSPSSSSDPLTAGASTARRSAGRGSPASVDDEASRAAAASRSSPAVRRLLTEHGLDAAAIRGTGQGGRITVDDVLQYVEQQRGAKSAAITAGDDALPNVTHGDALDGTVNAAAANGAGAPAGVTRLQDDELPNVRRVPHTPMRKRIAEHMVQSLLHTSPHVTSVFELDMSAVIDHRARHREEFQSRGASLTFTAYFLSAAVDAIRAVPEANSRWTDSALEIYDTIDIGIATALESEGLVVPVLRNVEQLDLLGIARGLQDLVTRAREGRLTPADVRGGTFTISNHGVSGSLLAAPIVINQPQSAILGVGKLEKRPVVIEEGGAERIAVQPRCYVTLTIDHRVMDGYQANRFLQVFVERLQNYR